MKRKIILFIFFATFFSFQIVSAFEIESYKITATVQTSATSVGVDNVIELMIKNDKTTSVTTGSLTIAEDAKIESISDSYGQILYNESYEGENKRVSFTFTIPIDAGETRVITLKSKTKNVVQKEGYFEYLLIVVPPQKISSFIHILKLSKEVKIRSTSVGTVIVPDATIAETDEYLLIEWDTLLVPEEPTVFLVRFSEDVGINYWKWFLVIMVVLLCGVIVGAIASRVYVTHKQSKALKATNILNEREKEVLGVIIKNPNIRQYEVVKQLGYTKSNMSKIVKRLEFRGLIEVKKEGKVRILNVGEKFKKQL